MDLYFLFQTEIKENLKWEKLQEPSSMDILASEVAGATILDNERERLWVGIGTGNQKT